MSAARSPLEADERWARVAWSLLAEPRSPTLLRLIEAYGAVETLGRLRDGRLDRREGWQVRLPDLDLDALRHATQRQGLHVLVPGDAGWPAGVVRL